MQNAIAENVSPHSLRLSWEWPSAQGSQTEHNGSSRSPGEKKMQTIALTPQALRAWHRRTLVKGAAYQLQDYLHNTYNGQASQPMHICRYGDREV